MEKNEVSELKVVARLIDNKQEIATLEKCFGFIEIKNEEETEIPTKTIDETITEFLQEIESKAKELGRVLKKEELLKITFPLIVFLIKRLQSELTLDIEVEKKAEERKEVDTNSDT
jgi:hypothetical protein